MSVLVRKTTLRVVLPMVSHAAKGDQIEAAEKGRPGMRASCHRSRTHSPPPSQGGQPSSVCIGSSTSVMMTEEERGDLTGALATAPSSSLQATRTPWQPAIQPWPRPLSPDTPEETSPEN